MLHVYCPSGLFYIQVLKIDYDLHPGLCCVIFIQKVPGV